MTMTIVVIAIIETQTKVKSSRVKASQVKSSQIRSDQVMSNHIKLLAYSMYTIMIVIIP